MIINKINGIMLVKRQVFRNFIIVNQLVVNKKPKPLDQVSSTGASALIHNVKVQNKLESKSSIFERLMDFATSVYDFRSTDKGNIRHRLETSSC